MDHHIIKIPLTTDLFDELDDAFIDQKETAHDFVWGQIRGLCKDAKIGKLNKICTFNVVNDGKPKQDQVKLRDVKLEELKSNPDWMPTRIDADEVKYFEHKITDKTLEYLNLFGSFALLRHGKYGDSMEVDHAEKLEKMKDNVSNPEVIEDAKKEFSEVAKNFREATPSCLEEVVFNAVFPAIHQEITKNIDKSFDKENEEMYPKEEKDKK